MISTVVGTLISFILLENLAGENVKFSFNLLLWKCFVVETHCLKTACQYSCVQGYCVQCHCCGNVMCTASREMCVTVKMVNVSKIYFKIVVDLSVPHFLFNLVA